MEEKRERFSYTKLDTYKQCPYRFKLKYEDGKYSFKGTIATDVGSILHKGKELIAASIINNEPVDYDKIRDLVYNGCEETNKGKTTHLKGIKEIEDEYFEQWYEPDNKSGMNYKEKMEIYLKNLKECEDTSEWKPKAVEHEFNFPYRDYSLYGFIDRLDINENGDFRVVDYKSSKASYRKEDLSTPLQMFIYALAVEDLFKKVPVEFLYDFILIDEKQNACTKGWYKRGIKKLDKIFDSIEESRTSGIYKPKPSPLCHWCEFCNTNTEAGKYKNECPYYSLWTPENKTYETNKKFDVNNLETNKLVEEFEW